MNQKKLIIKKPQSQVLAEVQEKLPDLFPHVEPERDWVWYAGPSLAGEQNKTKRETLKEIGFAFAKNGRELPSGKMGYWAHHCDKPIPFRRKGGERNPANSSRVENTGPARRDLDAIGAALLGDL